VTGRRALLVAWCLLACAGDTTTAPDDAIVPVADGQWLFVDYANDLVVVFTASLNSPSWPAVELLFGELLPALRPRASSLR
jgi:hypothetical protein